MPIRQILLQLQNLFKSISIGKRIALLILAVGFVAGFVFLMNWAGNPEFHPLYTNLDANDAGMIIPVVITVFQDRSFTFITKTPPAAVLLKKAAKVAKGAGDPKRDRVGKVTMAQVEEIAKIKMEDLNANDLAAACKIICGTARSMGIDVN